MDQICLVVPIMAGKTTEARDFTRELEESASPTTTSPKARATAFSGRRRKLRLSRTRVTGTGWEVHDEVKDE
jgi:hypothetical protein